MNEKIQIEQLDYNGGWVSEDGSYGMGKITLFHPERLTEENWDTLDNLGDSYKMPYVRALLQEQDTSEWEN
jgi:hypothetical protein